MILFVACVSTSSIARLSDSTKMFITMLFGVKLKTHVQWKKSEMFKQESITMSKITDMLPMQWLHLDATHKIQSLGFLNSRMKTSTQKELMSHTTWVMVQRQKVGFGNRVIVETWRRKKKPNMSKIVSFPISLVDHSISLLYSCKSTVAPCSGRYGAMARRAWRTGWLNVLVYFNQNFWSKNSIKFNCFESTFFFLLVHTWLKPVSSQLRVLM